MSLHATLHVAIYKDGGIYKHWSLFVEGPTDEEKIILHIMGSSTRYWFEMRKSNARASSTIAELVTLCDVPVSKIGAIKEAARTAPIHNESPGYNCQDFVLDLLRDLEAKKIVDSKDMEYMKKKEILIEKQEGFA